MTDPAPVQLDLEAVANRLGGQIGQQAVELAAAYQMVETLRRTVADLTVELAKAQGADGATAGSEPSVT